MGLKVNNIYIKWLAGIILTPVITVILLAVALYLPPVQNWAVDTVAQYASEELGMNITVDKVRLAVPLDLSVQGVKVIKPDSIYPQRKDTVADIREILVDVKLLPLFDSQVEIDQFDIRDAKINTTDFIPQARVKGFVGLLTLASHGIDLKKETLRLDNLLLAKADIDVQLSDTVPPDTTESENYWVLNLNDVKVRDAKVTVHMPGDTLQVGAVLGDVAMSSAHLDLGKSLYDVAKLSLRNGSVAFDNNYEPRRPGLDVNHLLLTDVMLNTDSLHFCAPDASANIRLLAFRESSGIKLKSLRAKVSMDSLQYKLNGYMMTPDSWLRADVRMDANAFADETPGTMEADLSASVGKHDLMYAMAGMPESFRSAWPQMPMKIDLKANGNMQRMNVENAEVHIPTAFSLKAKGVASDFTDIDRLNAKLHFDAHTYNLAFVNTLMDRSTARMINIPQMSATADLSVKGKQYTADMTLREGRGTMKAKGSLDAGRMAYNADVDARAFNLQHFVRGMGLGMFSGTASVSGRGTDIFSPSTKITANANIGQFGYDRWNFTGMDFDMALKSGHFVMKLDSRNEYLDGTVGLDAIMSRNPIMATLTAELDKADLYRMQIASQPLTVSGCAHVDVATDLADYYKVQGNFNDISFVDSAKVMRPEDIEMDIFTQKDSTHAVVDCGDFHLNSDIQGGYKYIMSLSDRLMAEVQRQWGLRIINEGELRKVLPVGKFYLSSGHFNPLARSLKFLDMEYGNVYMDFTSSPVEGINGEMKLDTLKAPGIQIDLVKGKLFSDESTIHYELAVENGPRNPQYTFKSFMKGSILPNGLNTSLAIDDDKGKRGVEVGLAAHMDERGIVLNMDSTTQILGYKKFSVNEDNYAIFSNDMRLSANIRLTADDGTGVLIYTDDDNEDALQDVTVSLHNFDLERLLSVVPYTPDVSGVMNGDFHAIMGEGNTSVSADVNFRNLIYEKSPIGNITAEFVYVPKDDGTHYVDGTLYKDEIEICQLTGGYNPEGEGYLDADVKMTDLPLDIFNGFVADQIAGLQGYGNGSLNVVGPLSKPVVNGEIFVRDASIVSVPYGVTMRIDNHPVYFDNSRIVLDNFKLYAYNNEPLVCNGSVDFSDLDHINVDMRMRAQNFQLINAKETRRSEAYGKAFVNFYAMVSGELSKLSVRGKIDLLPSTDLYYILRDSPLNNDNRMKELVTFRELTVDDNEVEVYRPTVDGLSIDMSISASDGAHVTCWLNADHSNYVDVIGGGDLRMRYNGDDLSLTGRYTISQGEMKYSLPIIPLKTFKISKDSYVEFNGDIMNPRLSITALEENKATATVNDVNMTVLFNCGVILSKTLNDMGLEFVIDAPENQTISDDLKMMSMEERGKLAVTMLTTGMYLSDGNTSGFSMNSALNSFLQQEIGKLTGSALRTIDLSFGIENNTDEFGQLHTDYSFKFAKRFWNNRLSISVGGKISTGKDASRENNTFFDNVELQYRFSDTSNQYLQLFYKHSVYDFLEGYVGQYGGGYMWKRKLQSLGEIFHPSDATMVMPARSTYFRKDTVGGDTVVYPVTRTSGDQGGRAIKASGK